MNKNKPISIRIALTVLGALLLGTVSPLGAFGEPAFNFSRLSVSDSNGQSAVIDVSQPERVPCVETGGAAESRICSVPVWFRLVSGSVNNLRLAAFSTTGKRLTTSDSNVLVRFVGTLGNAVARFETSKTVDVVFALSPDDVSHTIEGSGQTRTRALVPAQADVSAPVDISPYVTPSDLNATFATKNLTYNHFPVAVVRYPTRIKASEGCASIPISIGFLDFESGAVRTSGDTDFTEVSALIRTPTDEQNYDAAFFMYFESDLAVATNEEFVCGLDSKKGQISNINLEINTNWDPLSSTNSWNGWTKQAIEPFVLGALNIKIQVVGTSTYYHVACGKNGKYQVFKSKSLSCPPSYKRVNIPIVGGKLQKVTITCLKGLQARKVTGYLPTCPTGYTRS
jgi:hypothetical protein